MSNEEKQVRDIVTKFWISGVAYGMALMMQQQGLYADIDTDCLTRQILPDAIILGQMEEK